MRVLAAMSGGVDSSVAAARLVDAGHEVVGVHLALAAKSSGGASTAGPASARASRGCCTLDDARDARRVADRLGIPFYVWDMSERFRRDVVDDFLDEHRLGRTPNPCIRCNERIKFAAVLDRAIAMDFDAVATGHYAQVVAGPHGPELHRGVDPAKDQSYVLGVLQRSQLERVLLPIGGDDKATIRAEAQRRGFAVAQKPDSHDICFIPDGDTASFVLARLGGAPGTIVEAGTGATLGTHRGVATYTIGQRRGLDLRTPAPDGAPRYVVAKDVATATVTVGPAELLDVDLLEAGAVTWTGLPLDAPVDLQVQVRAHGEAVAARIDASGARLRVELATPVRGVACGQSVVVYDGTRVVGSGTIEATSRVARA